MFPLSCRPPDPSRRFTKTSVQCKTTSEGETRAAGDEARVAQPLSQLLLSLSCVGSLLITLHEPGAGSCNTGNPGNPRRRGSTCRWTWAQTCSTARTATKTLKKRHVKRTAHDDAKGYRRRRCGAACEACHSQCGACCPALGSSCRRAFLDRAVSWFFPVAKT